MDNELRERRGRTFDLLVVSGYPYSEVVKKIATEYDLTEGGVKADISRMDTWLPKLVDEDPSIRTDGLVRLKELRKNRQRLERMAREAATKGDLETELRIRERIDDNIDLDFALSQSLGLTNRRPADIEMQKTYRVESDVVSVEVLDEDERDLVWDEEAG